ncbi:hypothetical protein HNR30_006858 [Nonomuraea soli]|uniref:Uncharacterized protein n=1 Tax=Nonomuraea soli TaxID=1032476 RepID=A0A7W0CQP0_9ACTN|nr:hypothetical protein [Nonomuraea soli]
MGLGAALLAPAILAGGLMAGELGYQRQAADEGKGAAAALPGGAPAVRGVVFEPVLAPAPARPDRVYGGMVPAPEREPQRDEPGVVVEPGNGGGETVRVPRTEGSEGAERPRRGPVRPAEGCPGEWEETWLWELCREHERQSV